MTSLQSFQRAAKAPTDISLHSEPYGNVSLPNSIAVFGDGREAHGDYPFMLAQLGNEVHVDSGRSVVKDNDPFVPAVVVNFTDCAHQKSFSRAEA